VTVHKVNLPYSAFAALEAAEVALGDADTRGDLLLGPTEGLARDADDAAASADRVGDGRSSQMRGAVRQVCDARLEDDGL
jgi:hypothetical protein